MLVATLQLDCVWEDKAANYAKVRGMLAGIAPDTLVILPEMFATGFTANLALAEDTGEAVAAIAKEYRVNLLAGLVRKIGGPRFRAATPTNGRAEARPSEKWTNEAVLFNTEGREVARYAKLHPFRPGGEATEAGTATVIVSIGEFQLAPVICYDLRFPEDFRASVKRGANVFAVIASWPASRIEHWLALLKARAIENQAYVIGANRCGADPNHTYPGRSQIISPRGEVLADAGAAECVLSVALDLPVLESYRREFPVLQTIG